METGFNEAHIHAFVLIRIHLTKRYLFMPFFTAAFEITIDHPHTHVVKCTQLVRGKHQVCSLEKKFLMFQHNFGSLAGHTHSLCENFLL